MAAVRGIAEEELCEAIAVNDLIEEARELSRADANHILMMKVEDGLPALYADRRAALQMMLNLLSNAVKFTSPGGTVDVTAAQTNRVSASASSEVTDDGLTEVERLCAEELKKRGGPKLTIEQIKEATQKRRLTTPRVSSNSNQHHTFRLTCHKSPYLY